MQNVPPQDLTFLVDHELLQVGIGRYEVVLTFDGDVAATIVGRFQVGERGPVEVLPAAAIRLLPLLAAKVTRATVDDEGHAIITFSTGETVRLLNDAERYESYQFVAATPDVLA